MLILCFSLQMTYIWNDHIFWEEKCFMKGEGYGAKIVYSISYLGNKFKLESHWNKGYYIFLKF